MNAVWVDSKKGRRPPLRLFASWLGSPFAAAQVKSTPPIRAPCTTTQCPVVPHRSRSRSRLHLVMVVGLPACARSLKGPPPHARTTPLPFLFSFSPSPSLPSLTHRQLISRLRDLPFFLTLYSLTLPAFFRLQPHSFGCPRRSFWHSFTLVSCSLQPDITRLFTTFRFVTPLATLSLSKSNPQLPQLVDGISTFFGLHHFFSCSYYYHFLFSSFPTWGFLDS